MEFHCTSMNKLYLEKLSFTVDCMVSFGDSVVESFLSYLPVSIRHPVMILFDCIISYSSLECLCSPTLLQNREIATSDQSFEIVMSSLVRHLKYWAIRCVGIYHFA